MLQSMNNGNPAAQTDGRNGRKPGWGVFHCQQSGLGVKRQKILRIGNFPSCINCILSHNSPQNCNFNVAENGHRSSASEQWKHNSHSFRYLFSNGNGVPIFSCILLSKLPPVFKCHSYNTNSYTSDHRSELLQRQRGMQV